MKRRSPSAAAPEGRFRDRSFVLTALTFILLTPPIITVFNVPILVAGIPLLHIYCFGVWLAAIVAGGFLAARSPGNDTGRRKEESFRRG